MEILNSILDLCEINSVSGKEDEIVDFLTEKLKKYSNNIKTTALKSVIAKINTSIKNSSKMTIALEAHIDSIGLIVTKITKEGYLKIANCGGMDPYALTSQEVVVLGNKNYPGFIFTKKNDNKEKITIKDLFIDVNLTEKSAKNNIKKGDYVVFKHKPTKLQNNRLSVRFLDNRISVAAILLVLERLKQKKLNCEIIVFFSSLEETTQAGVKTAAFSNKPDIAIAVDVSFAESLNFKEAGIGKMGDGPLIGISPVLDRNLSNKLIEIAKNNKIPHQIEPMSGLTRTNADEIATIKDGIKTMLCSIPIKNMHTPTEIVEIEDVVNTTTLIEKFILSI